MQLATRRALIKTLLPFYRTVWPIHPASGKAPEGWSGWPEEKKFALILTHDVDTQGGHDNCQNIALLEEGLGFRSSFNFVAQGYKVSTDILNNLTSRGFEIALHGLKHKNPFSSEKAFLDQAPVINQYLTAWNAAGFRSPSMYHNLEWIHRLNVEYDASTFDTDPFEPQPDGVATIFPFWVQDHTSGNGFVELPYTLPQDFLLFILMQERNISIWQNKLDWIVENGGMALFITHPDYMSFDGKVHYEKYPSEYYEEFLNYIKRKYEGQYWNVLPRDVARFWEQNYSRIVDHNKNGRSQTEREIMVGSAIRTKEAPVRSLMITESNYPDDVRIRQEANTLIKNGHAVTVIALGDKGQKFKEVIDGVFIYRVPKWELFKKSKQKSSANVSKVTRTMILLAAIFGYGLEFTYFTGGAFLLSLLVRFRKGFDVIHTHNPPDTLFIVPVFHKLLGGKQFFIYDHHDLSPELFFEKYGAKGKTVYKLLRYFELWSLRQADLVIATNNSYREIESERCGVAPDNIFVVRNGPDLNRIRKTTPLEEIRRRAETVLCYLGAINIQDGVQNLLLVLDRLLKSHPDCNVCLLIIGDGDHLHKIREMAEVMNLTDHVCFTGGIKDPEQLNSYLSSADIFLDAAAGTFLNHSSTFIKHMEYMVFGKPVVSYALKESMFSLQEAGVFVEPDNIDEMSQTIFELIRNKSKRETVGLKGLERVKQLTWETVSTPLLEAYQRIPMSKR